MKTKTVLILLFSALFLLQFTTTSHALWNKDVKKAKEFMQVDMYPEAVELLKKLIYEKPTDAEVHYLLGTCYLHQGNFYRADESFGRATKLKPAYKQDISDMYFEAGNIVGGEQSLDLYARAAKFSSSHNEKIGQKLIAMAKAKGTSEADKAFYKEEASRYLSKAEMNKAFPPAIIAKKGDKPTFILKAGEYSPFIKAPYGSGFKFQKQYGDVEICWRDGKCFAPDKLPDNKEGDFRFHCITDCDVRAVIYK